MKVQEVSPVPGRMPVWDKKGGSLFPKTMLASHSVSESSNADLPWYAVRVRSNFEHTSLKALENRGLETFLPSFKTRRRWSDRIRLIDQPLFPGYLFCKFDAVERGTVLRAPGVVHLVSSGSEPLPVDDSELDHVRTVVLAEMAVRPHPYLRVGQRAKVEAGPLAGAEGIVTAEGGRSSLILSLSLLQRAIAVEIEADCLRAI